MKIYQVTMRRSFDEHDGYEYFTNKKEAEKAQKQSNDNCYTDEIREINFKMNKKEILGLLILTASHPDNG